MSSVVICTGVRVGIGAVGRAWGKVRMAVDRRRVRELGGGETVVDISAGGALAQETPQVVAVVEI